MLSGKINKIASVRSLQHQNNKLLEPQIITSQSFSIIHVDCPYVRHIQSITLRGKCDFLGC